MGFVTRGFGYEVRYMGFGVCSVGFEVWGLGSEDQNLGFEIWDTGFECQICRETVGKTYWFTLPRTLPSYMSADLLQGLKTHVITTYSYKYTKYITAYLTYLLKLVLQRSKVNAVSIPYWYNTTIYLSIVIYMKISNFTCSYKLSWRYLTYK